MCRRNSEVSSLGKDVVHLKEMQNQCKIHQSKLETAFLILQNLTPLSVIVGNIREQDSYLSTVSVTVCCLYSETTCWHMKSLLAQGEQPRDEGLKGQVIQVKRFRESSLLFVVHQQL